MRFSASRPSRKSCARDISGTSSLTARSTGRGRSTFAACSPATASSFANAPLLVARRIVAGGFDPSYDYALQTLHEVPYDKWREFDAEDAIRFYALRLHEIGMIKSSPQKIIAENTDWRFLNEIKRELKA